MKPAHLLSGLLAVAMLARAAHAQPATGTPETPRRERARTFLVLRIVDALNLNDQDALKVSAIVRQSDEHRQQLVKQRQSLEDQLRTALVKQPADPTALGSLVSQGNDIDQKIALVPEDTFRELQKVLTVEQQAKLMLFRRELQGEIRRAVQGRRFGGGRRGKQGNGPTDEP